MARSITKAKKDKEESQTSIMKAAVSHQLASAEPGEVSKLFLDGGAAAEYVTRMVKAADTRCTIARMSETEVKEGIFRFFETCEAVKQPPTIGGLALWFSATIPTIQRWASKDDPRGEWFALGIQACQQFAEIKAMDGTMNPIVYIYQNKAYHGYIETQRLEVVDGGKVLSVEDIDAVIEMLPNEDGVYRVP